MINTSEIKNNTIDSNDTKILNNHAHQKLEYPFGIYIPGLVATSKKLSYFSKMLFGCLTVFADKYGYAWISNENLAEMHECAESSIKRALNSLEKEGFIEREIENVPYQDEEKRILFKSSRKIYVNNGFARTRVKKDENNKDFQIICGGCKNEPPDGGCKNEPLNILTKYTKKKESKPKKAPQPPKGESPSLSPKKTDPEKEKRPKKEITSQAKELTSFVHEKVKASNPLNIPASADKTRRDKELAQALIERVAESRDPKLSLDEALVITKRVADTAMEDEFWSQHFTGVSYLKTKWGQLSKLLNKPNPSRKPNNFTSWEKGKKSGWKADKLVIKNSRRED